ncbi:MAG: twin-arginine translocase TatA/TatE family subunit [Gammaproteobacteria bacterium]|uniref:Sec-independent protein translocase protein TatA n=1 Tax=Tolumonas osonensis TaxID=675874 RepID=A0A841GBG4_9GAMM|nr:twin-arginine translocase TatA/TatE family subunit [Tolumonas osonensis]MBB6054957.1 sec-independent protein translocase protein TatA [Tolumonas osonensis]NCB61533.1 twin-arginine translocase TatA/TatE family subunit [Gammaproteobacteria bacterium]
MNIGITELLLIAVIVFLLFGTRKLRGIGGDLGTAIRDFKSAMSDNKSSAVAGNKPVTAPIENDKE